MRLFYKAFDIRDAARHESSPADERRPVIGVNLSWTHYRLLTRVHQPAARRSTSTKPSSAAGAPAKLDRQITTRFYERGLAHRGTTASTALTPITEASPAESVLRDPYVLEFLDLRDRADTENAHLFNAPAGGALHVENLKGVSGEVALRVGDHEPFGVINVGDDDKLCSCARNAPSWW